MFRKVESMKSVASERRHSEKRERPAYHQGTINLDNRNLSLNRNDTLASPDLKSTEPTVSPTSIQSKKNFSMSHLLISKSRSKGPIVHDVPALSPHRRLSEQSRKDITKHAISRPLPDSPVLLDMSPKIHSERSRRNDIHITTLDHIIKNSGGTTVATDRLSTEMEQSKHRRAQSIEEENLELKQLIGRLQAEVAYLTETRAALMSLYAGVVKVYQESLGTQNKVQSVIQRSTVRMQKAENQLLSFWGIQIKSEVQDDFF